MFVKGKSFKLRPDLVEQGILKKVTPSKLEAVLVAFAFR